MLNAEYFKRIDALNFTMIHDDGQQPENLEQADVVLLLSDVTRRDEPEHQQRDRDIEAQLRRRVPASAPVVRVHNKIDACSLPLSWQDDGVLLSARTGAGLEALRQRMPALVWKSARGEYALEDAAMHRWYEKRSQAKQWPPAPPQGLLPLEDD